jgi:hypothetical protein
VRCTRVQHAYPLSAVFERAVVIGPRAAIPHTSRAPLVYLPSLLLSHRSSGPGSWVRSLSGHMAATLQQRKGTGSNGSPAKSTLLHGGAADDNRALLLGRSGRTSGGGGDGSGASAGASGGFGSGEGNESQEPPGSLHQP